MNRRARRAPRRRPLDKAVVAGILDDVGDLMELRGGKPFEARAYHNAARTIGSLDADLDDLVTTGHLANVPGLGKTLLQRILELVTTGQMVLHQQLLAETPPGLRQMLRIPGRAPTRGPHAHATPGI